jgi:3D (Asp-Asp-Asp) domain-containing protein
MPGRVLSVVAKSGSTYYTQQSDGVAARTAGGVVTSETGTTVSTVTRVIELGSDLFIIGHSVPLGGILPAARGVYRVAKSALGTIAASDTSTGTDYFLDAVTDGTNLFLATSEGTVRKYSTALALLATYSLTAPNYINALAFDAGALYVAQGYLGTAQLIKFDIATEAVVWTVSVPEMRAYSGTLAVISGAVVMVTSAGFLRFSVTDGAALSSLVLPDDFGASSIYALDGRLLAGIYTVVTVPGATYTYQHIAEFDPATRAVLWRSEALGVSSTSITLLGSELWFANSRIESTGSSDLSGYTLTVYQISDTVGRGFPASASIT